MKVLNRQILEKILRLDTIFLLLDYSERMNVRGNILNWEWAEVSPRVLRLAEWLKEEAAKDIQLPELKVGQDRLTYVYESQKGELYPIEKYRKDNAHKAKDLRAVMDA